MNIFLSREHILEEITFLEELNINRDLFIQYMLSCPLVFLDKERIVMDKETYKWFEELIELLRKAKEAFLQVRFEEYIEQHINVMLNADCEENWLTIQEDLKQALADAINPRFFMVATKTCHDYVNIDKYDEVLLEAESIKQCSFLQLLKHVLGDYEINRIDYVIEEWSEDDPEYIIAEKFINGSLRDKLNHFLQLDTSYEFHVIEPGNSYEFEMKRALERENNSIHIGEGISTEGFGYLEYFYLDDDDRVYYSNLQNQAMKNSSLEEEKVKLIENLEWEIFRLIDNHPSKYDGYWSLEAIVEEALENEEGVKYLRKILEGKEVS